MARNDKSSKAGTNERGSRVLDGQDAGRFSHAADKYVAANTASQSTARATLRDLGFINSSGKPKKPYG